MWEVFFISGLLNLTNKLLKNCSIANVRTKKTVRSDTRHRCAKPHNKLPVFWHKATAGYGG